MTLLSMTVVSPNVLTDINFAEIVEDENHPTLKMRELLNHKVEVSYKDLRLALSILSKVEYQRYKDIFESTHIMELHSPPPNC